MNVVHAHPIVVAMAESCPQEAMVANRYNFRVETTGQGFVSVSEIPTRMVPGPPHLYGALERFLNQSGSRRAALPGEFPDGEIDL